MLETLEGIHFVCRWPSGSSEVVSFTKDWEKAVNPVKVEMVTGVAKRLVMTIQESQGR